MPRYLHLAVHYSRLMKQIAYISDNFETAILASTTYGPRLILPELCQWPLGVCKNRLKLVFEFRSEACSSALSIH